MRFPSPLVGLLRHKRLASGVLQTIVPGTILSIVPHSIECVVAIEADTVRDVRKKGLVTPPSPVAREQFFDSAYQVGARRVERSSKLKDRRQ